METPFCHNITMWARDSVFATIDNIALLIFLHVRKRYYISLMAAFALTQSKPCAPVAVIESLCLRDLPAVRRHTKGFR
jgi:hypothetical protein